MQKEVYLHGKWRPIEPEEVGYFEELNFEIREVPKTEITIKNTRNAGQKKKIEGGKVVNLTLTKAAVDVLQKVQPKKSNDGKKGIYASSAIVEKFDRENKKEKELCKLKLKTVPPIGK